MNMFTSPEGRRALLRIFLVFLPMAFLGTQLHELGHWTVAEYYGFEPELHYGSVSYHESEKYRLYQHYLSIYWNDSTDQEAFKKSEHWPFVERTFLETVFVTLGGPAQNMIFGTIGLIWLWALRRRRRLEYSLAAMEWGVVILALFWSRQVFNGLTGIVYWVVQGYWAVRGDESRLSRDISNLVTPMPTWTVNAITGILGLVACLLVVKWFPASHRRHLLVAAPVSCIVGFIIWYYLLGPWLMP
jgi:hypothetical protein